MPYFVAIQLKWTLKITFSTVRYIAICNCVSASVKFYVPLKTFFSGVRLSLSIIPTWQHQNVS